MNPHEAYQRLFGFDNPYHHQLQLHELARSGQFPLLLRAPCGTGKTEAAVCAYLAQFITNDYCLPPRLIYVLPTQALCNDIHRRLQKAAGAAGTPLVTSAQHGAAPNDHMMFSDIVVTTLDHFVYAYARSSGQIRRHIDLPAGCIASSLVVFDEAHLYQSPYTFSVMRAMLEILNAARIPFIVMTATMPRSLQESFAEHISFTRVAYADDAPDRNLDIQLRLQRPLIDDNDIDHHALAAMSEADRTLIVVNTVQTAQHLYRLIDGPDRSDVALIHSRYISADRDKHEQAAKHLLENSGTVVSTQVCEAGLDVSADLLITELAPADSIIQRAGRCARLHHEHSHQTPSGTVLLYCAQKHPYEGPHLWDTCKYLHEHPELDLTHWAHTCRFADRMPYAADDVAARDSLFDLYEATLYADRRPWAISVREGKYLYGWVGDPDQLANMAPDAAADYYRHHQITLAYTTALGLGNASDNATGGIFDFTKSGGYTQLYYDRSADGNRWSTRRQRNMAPLQTYIIDPECYDSDLGVVPHDE